MTLTERLNRPKQHRNRKKKEAAPIPTTIDIHSEYNKDYDLFTKDNIATVKAYGNTILSLTKYYRTIHIVWNDILGNTSQFFDVNTDEELAKRYRLCNQMICNHFKELSGINVKITYRYFKTKTEWSTDDLMNDLARSGYFLIEKINDEDAKKREKSPKDNSALEAFEEGKKCSVRQIASILKRDCTISQCGRITIRPTLNTVKEVNTIDDLTNYILQSFNI